MDLGMSSGASELSLGRYVRQHAKSLIGNPGKLKEPRLDGNSSRSSSRNTGCCTAAAACVASAAFRVVFRTPAARRSGSQRSPVGRDLWVLIECSRWQRRPSQGRRDSDTHVCAPSLLDMATGLLPVRPCGYTCGDDPVHQLAGAIYLLDRRASPFGPDIVRIADQPVAPAAAPQSLRLPQTLEAAIPNASRQEALAMCSPPLFIKLYSAGGRL